MIKKVVVLGPESTGKSTLCKQLATHYEALWCPEYAREYLLQNGTEYQFNHLHTIGQGQLKLEETYVQKTQERMVAGQSSLLFIDTSQHVMKVWCEFVFNDCHNWMLRQIAEKPYDLFLLCNIDLPWVKDELREYPNEKPRYDLFRIYKDMMVNQKIPWSLISGNEDARLQAAIASVDGIL